MPYAVMVLSWERERLKHMEFLFLIRVIAPLRQPPVVNEGGCWFINENLRSSGEHGGYEVRQLPRASWESESVKPEYSLTAFFDCRGEADRARYNSRANLVSFTKPDGSMAFLGRDFQNRPVTARPVCVVRYETYPDVSANIKWIHELLRYSRRIPRPSLGP